MPVTAIVGANWGDEGKGKITDWLAGEADYVVRYQGGSNAGHTIVNEFGKFVLNLLPSGIFNPGTTNVIGPGVALNLTEFFREWDALLGKGVKLGQVFISDRAQLVLPYHQQLDEWEEERLGDSQFGSTRQGIAPFYSDKYLKLGIQTADLYDTVRLQDRLERALSLKNTQAVHLYGKPAWKQEEWIPGLLEQAERIRPLICNTTSLLHQALKQNKTILVEGQLGALRDPDHGIYPFSTSSSTLAGFATVGAGVPPHAITKVISVVKAYSSCVGAGPFVTELEGDRADELRRRGGDAGEYGAVTGRPRRVGWFDAVASRYGCQVQGTTEAVLTNLDVLGYLQEIPICTAYKINDQAVREFPPTSLLEQAEPIWEVLPGWEQDISTCRHYEELPAAAKQYIERLEEELETPFSWISCGPSRSQMIKRK